MKDSLSSNVEQIKNTLSFRPERSEASEVEEPAFSVEADNAPALTS